MASRTAAGEASEGVMPAAGGAPRVSIVIPCLNEAETIGTCVAQVREALATLDLPSEIIVVDNGSGDGSGELARAAGARVVDEPRRGYGSAYLTGLSEARGEEIVMLDADLTYDASEIPRFVAALQAGAELVMGDRMQGIQPGAMRWLNRIGNAILSGFLNLLFRTGVRDVHCGMRALRRSVLPRLHLRTTGMEFASEMVIRAAKEGLVITEIPIKLHARGGESKLSPLRDGWRHLRLILVYSPTFLFMLPGGVMVVAGIFLMGAVLGHLTLFGRGFYEHTLIGGSLLVIIGAQVVGLGICGRTYAVYHLGVADPLVQRWRSRFRLEHGLLAGFLLTLAGLAGGGYIVAQWISRGFGTLADQRLAIVAATAIMAGVQVIFTSFLLSLLGLGRER